jgi:hypothetical protein
MRTKVEFFIRFQSSFHKIFALRIGRELTILFGYLLLPLCKGDISIFCSAIDRTGGFKTKREFGVGDISCSIL